MAYAHRSRSGGSAIVFNARLQLRPHRWCDSTGAKAMEPRRAWLRASSAGAQPAPFGLIAAGCPRPTVTGLGQTSSRISASCAGPAKRVINSPGSCASGTGGKKRAHVACHSAVFGNCSHHQSRQRASAPACAAQRPTPCPAAAPARDRHGARGSAPTSKLHAGGTPHSKSSGARSGRRELQPDSPVACAGSRRGAARPRTGNHRPACAQPGRGRCAAAGRGTVFSNSGMSLSALLGTLAFRMS